MANKVKKTPTINRAGSATPRDAASIAASSVVLMDTKRPRITIWPEWNDVDVNAEKWEAAHKGGKDKEKGKSPTVVTTQVLFEDPEGKIELPASLKVDSWKRPHDIITNQQPVVVENEGAVTEFDLVSNNEHLHLSELMRNIICQVHSLWTMSTVKPIPPESGDGMSPCEEMINTWKPWEHIYSLCKAGKGQHLPIFNQYGKYIVRLYWMGCWRKITIDDTIPLDNEGNILLPMSTTTHELWPLLLVKGLIKVASLDYAGGNGSSEYGDYSILHCLSGRLPEAIPLQNSRTLTPSSTPAISCMGNYMPKKEFLYPEQVLDEFRQMVCQPFPACCAIKKEGGIIDGLLYSPTLLPNRESNGQGHMNALWDLLKVSVGEWELPEQEWQRKEREAALAEKEAQNLSYDTIKEEKPEKENSSKETKEKPESKVKEGKGKDKGKEGKEDKKKDKEKDKHKEKSPIEEIPIPDKPELCVFAYYWSAPNYPVKVSVLGDVADASENLRQHGLCHLYPHPIWITQTRSISMEPPPPPIHVPAWKLIRPRTQKPPISADPIEPPPSPKPIQCLEIHSPFINYKVSAMQIPTDTKRPQSALLRCQTHSHEGLQDCIHETEEVPSQSPDEIKLATPDVTMEVPEITYSPPLSAIASECLDVTVYTTVVKNEKEELREKEVKDRKEAEVKEIKEKENKETREAVFSKIDNKKSTRKNSKINKVDGKEKHKDKEKDDEKHAKGNLVPAHHTNSGLKSSICGDTTQGGLSQPRDTSPHLDDTTSHLSVALDEDGAQKSKQLWMDYDTFYKCFKSVFIYHRPQTYQYREKITDIKNLALPSTVSPVKDKKATASSQVPGEDRPPYYMFVDSLEPIEIVVSYTVISRWNEPHPVSTIPPPEEKKHSSSKLKEKDVDKEKEMTTMTTSSVLDECDSEELCDDVSDSASTTREHTSLLTIPSGTLVAEPYCWKSLVTGQPILRIRTTGTRAAVLSLPIGRHVLRFIMSAPLGYHIHLCSTTKFVFGDEDTVMAELTKESCRFIENAVQVMTGVGKCMQTFSNTTHYHTACDELVKAHCPYRYDKTMSKHLHFSLFNDSLYALLRKTLGDLISPDVVFAWRAINFDATTRNILGNISGSRPGTSTAGASHRGSGKQPANKKQLTMDVEMERVGNSWSTRDITVEEQVCAIKIQKVWRGYWVRKIAHARVPGSEDNIKVMEQLQKCYAVLGQNEEKIREHGLMLMRHLFKETPEIMPYYNFYNDEWNKISYADYQGSYLEHQPHSWFLVFREIFYVLDEALVVPKLYCSLPMCLLRVVNNDTGEDMHRVFQKVAPHVYKRNKRGYTFVAEARTTDIGQAAGKWRMRLIGSFSPLPSPAKPDVTCLFQTHEIQDYYIPNENNVIARYAVKVADDHLASIQICTSKPDVYIKISVLDCEDEVTSCTGKGHVVIPAIIFQANPHQPHDDVDDKRTGSRGSGRPGRTSAIPLKTTGKQASSLKSPDIQRMSPYSGNCEEDKDAKSHKYIIQAVVLRNSWPLSEGNWAFVQTLKEQEKNDLKVINKEREQSPQKDKEKSGFGVTQKQSKTLKGGKEKMAKDGRASRPVSQQMAHDKPFYTLRVVSDHTNVDDIDIKKDTERADEIRAMKRAWEEAEPGRAAKALQSRLKYLGTHMVHSHSHIVEDEVTVADMVFMTKETQQAHLTAPSSPVSMNEPETYPSVLSIQPPRPTTPTEVLQPLDITPFLKPCLGVPRYFDEAEEKKQLEEKQIEIERFKELRERVEMWRQQDKLARKQAKKQQIEDCEMLQGKLDTARDLINIPREQIRQKYLEIERKKLDEAMALEAAKAQLEAKSPKNKSAKGKNASAKGKKK